jgi:hypothetical protein
LSKDALDRLGEIFLCVQEGIVTDTCGPPFMPNNPPSAVLH